LVFDSENRSWYVEYRWAEKDDIGTYRSQILIVDTNTN